MLNHLNLLGKVGIVNAVLVAVLNITSGISSTGSLGLALVDYLFGAVGLGSMAYALRTKMSSTATFAVSFVGWVLFLLLELGFRTGIVPSPEA